MGQQPAKIREEFLHAQQAVEEWGPFVDAKQSGDHVKVLTALKELDQMAADFASLDGFTDDFRSILKQGQQKLS